MPVTLALGLLERRRAGEPTSKRAVGARPLGMGVALWLVMGAGTLAAVHLGLGAS